MRRRAVRGMGGLIRDPADSLSGGGKRSLTVASLNLLHVTVMSSRTPSLKLPLESSARAKRV